MSHEHLRLVGTYYSDAHDAYLDVWEDEETGQPVRRMLGGEWL